MPTEYNIIESSIDYDSNGEILSCVFEKRKNVFSYDELMSRFKEMQEINHKIDVIQKAIELRKKLIKE